MVEHGEFKQKELSQEKIRQITRGFIGDYVASYYVAYFFNYRETNKKCVIYKTLYNSITMHICYLYNI